jgi:hypothetical protein
LAKVRIYDPEPGVGLIFTAIDRDILKVCQTFRPLAVTYDQWNSIPSIQMLRGHGINVIQTSFNRSFKMKIYQNLKTMMTYPEPDGSELLLYNDPRLILEMKSLKYRPVMRGVSFMPDKSSDVPTDDVVDCLAGAVAMASENITPRLPAPVCVYTGWR